MQSLSAAKVIRGKPSVLGEAKGSHGTLPQVSSAPPRELVKVGMPRELATHY